MKNKGEGEVATFLLAPASAQSSPSSRKDKCGSHRAFSLEEHHPVDRSHSRGADLHPQRPRRLPHDQVGDKGASTLPGLLGPISAWPYHHFRGGSGWESRGNQHPGQRLEQLRGHSELSGRASATTAPRKTQQGKILPFSVHALLN